MQHSFLDHYSHLASPIQRCDARVKLVITLVFIITAVSTPPDLWLAWGGYLFLVVCLLVMSRLPWHYLFTRVAVVLPFIGLLLVCIPFMRPELGGSFSFGVARTTPQPSTWLICWNVFIKAILGVLAVIILSATTPFPKLLGALYAFHCPAIFIMLASFTYRYLFVLVDELYRLKRAGEARGFAGKWLWNARFMGEVIGTVFLRSYERGERIYIAMVARGFQGSATYEQPEPLRQMDYLITLVAVATVLLLRCLPLSTRNL